jgi:hypothetical protein
LKGVCDVPHVCSRTDRSASYVLEAMRICGITGNGSEEEESVPTIRPSTAMIAVLTSKDLKLRSWPVPSASPEAPSVLGPLIRFMIEVILGGIAP